MYSKSTNQKLCVCRSVCERYIDDRNMKRQFKKIGLILLTLIYKILIKFEINRRKK